MFEKLYPDAWVASTYEIPFEKLYKRGYRGVIFDIDNTLVPHGAPADARAEQLFKRLDEIGFQYSLISNNKGPRVEMFNKNIHAYTVCNAHKPMIENYLKAAFLMDVPKEKVLLSVIRFSQISSGPDGREFTVFLSGQSIQKRKFRLF